MWPTALATSDCRRRSSSTPRRSRSSPATMVLRPGTSLTRTITTRSRTGATSRRRDCHFDDAAFLSVLKHPTNVGGGSRVTVSPPTARCNRTATQYSTVFGEKVGESRMIWIGCAWTAWPATACAKLGANTHTQHTHSTRTHNTHTHTTHTQYTYTHTSIYTYNPCLIYLQVISLVARSRRKCTFRTVRQ